MSARRESSHNEDEKILSYAKYCALPKALKVELGLELRSSVSNSHQVSFSQVYSLVTFERSIVKMPQPKIYC